MGGTFYGLEIAKTGIFASQRALNIARHNIANANTVGYTRQRLNLSSIARAQLMVFWRRVKRLLLAVVFGKLHRTNKG